MLQQVVEDWKGTAFAVHFASIGGVHSGAGSFHTCIQVIKTFHDAMLWKGSKKRGDVHCIGVQTHAKLNMYHEHVSIHCTGIHWMFLKARV